MIPKEITITKLGKSIPTDIVLPASKSVNNRAVIINHLAGNTTELVNPSNARDSLILSRLVESKDNVMDARDAGTTFRFLTAFFTIKKRSKLLTGTERMKQRPIGELVDTLRKLGAKISYSGKENYPPISIDGFRDNGLESVEMKGDISSQFISAVMMISPLLKKGLIINLKGKLGSRPYIEMTAEIMRQFGAEVNFDQNIVKISNKPYAPPQKFEVEPDWSAASYWYALVSIGGLKGIRLSGLKSKALQGDRVIVDIMNELGVSTEFDEKGALLHAIKAQSSFSFDFRDCPDLAQTISVICGAKGIKCSMRGLESLKIKETNRVEALRTELNKFDVRFIENDNGWFIDGRARWPDNIMSIDTYEDHRMAMSFAALAPLGSLKIIDPSVVDKSYPNFWKDLDSIRP